MASSAALPLGSSGGKGSKYSGGNALVDDKPPPPARPPNPPTTTTTGGGAEGGDPLSTSSTACGGGVVGEKAPPYVWLKAESKDGSSWRPLRVRDSQALEKALLTAAPGAEQEDDEEGSDSKVVFVEQGRYKVDLGSREMSPAYWVGDRRRVLRSLWFYKSPGPLGLGGSNWTPYEEKDSDIIEALYQSLARQTPPPPTTTMDESTSTSMGKKEVLLSDGVHKVVATMKPSSSLSSSSTTTATTAPPATPTTTTTTTTTQILTLNASMTTTTTTDGEGRVTTTITEGAGPAGNTNHTTTSATADLSPPVPSQSEPPPLPPVEQRYDFVQQRVSSYSIGVLHNKMLRRGYGEYVVEGEAEEGDRATDHLVFVVHGIGEKIWSAMDASGGVGEGGGSGTTTTSMPSLKTSVEYLRRNTLLQQIAKMEPAAATTTITTTSSSSSSSCRASRGSLDDSGGGGGGSRCPASSSSSSQGLQALFASRRQASSLSSSTTTTTDATTTTPPAAPSGDGGDGGVSGSRVEFIPVEWFDAIRQDESDLTRRIQRVTLPSVPLFRQFANDAVMDVLLYMNPSFRQRILDTVASRINRVVAEYKKNNPHTFSTGKVSLVGHSLGSVILFDLLAHQRSQDTTSTTTTVTPLDPSITYPQLDTPIHTLLVMGSPIGMFLTLREQTLPPSFTLPTTSHFYNVFHPHDPVAYRIEPILQPAMCKLEPALVPYHGPSATTLVTKLRDNQKMMASIGSSLTSGWNRVMATVASSSITNTLASANAAADESLKQPLVGGGGEGEGGEDVADVSLVRLNQGRRLDYALQEGVIESANEYLSAISSHSCYFNSLDVALMLARVLRDIDPSSTNTNTCGGGGAGAVGII